MNGRPLVLGLSLAAAALVTSSCGAAATNGTSILSIPKSSSGGAAHGTANVGYAGSLVGLVQTTLQPAFEKATGDSFVGKGEGSTALAKAILDDELSPGAFVAVGRKAIKSLWPSRSHFVLTLATDPLVVAYSPNSRYAAQLNAIRSGAKPLSSLFTLFERRGFRLGRSDPNLDPQGGFFMLMFQLATKKLHLPAGTAAKILGTSASNPIGSTSQIFDETALPTDIASGTVDAGSEFLTEAKQFKLNYITLPPTLNFGDPAKAALYGTVSLTLTGGAALPGEPITLDEALVLPPSGQTRSAADQAADEAWLAFLLSPKGQSLLKRAGYVLEAPKLGLAPGYTSAKSVLPSRILSGYRRLEGSVTSS